MGLEKTSLTFGADLQKGLWLKKVFFSLSLSLSLSLCFFFLSFWKWTFINIVTNFSGMDSQWKKSVSEYNLGLDPCGKLKLS